MKTSIYRIAAAGTLVLLASAAVPAFADPSTCPKGTHIDGRSCVADLPEPGSLPLFLLGAAAIGVARRVFKKK